MTYLLRTTLSVTRKVWYHVVPIPSLEAAMQDTDSDAPEAQELRKEGTAGCKRAWTTNLITDIHGRGLVEVPLAELLEGLQLRD